MNQQVLSDEILVFEDGKLVNILEQSESGYKPRYAKYQMILGSDFYENKCVSIIKRDSDRLTLLSDWIAPAKPHDSLLSLAYWFSMLGCSIHKRN
jgi:hypothetical protein